MTEYYFHVQGKRTWDETYEKPPQYNAYTEPWFDEKYAHIEHPTQQDALEYQTENLSLDRNMSCNWRDSN